MPTIVWARRHLCVFPVRAACTFVLPPVRVCAGARARMRVRSLPVCATCTLCTNVPAAPPVTSMTCLHRFRVCAGVRACVVRVCVCVLYHLLPPPLLSQSSSALLPLWSVSLLRPSNMAENLEVLETPLHSTNVSNISSAFFRKLLVDPRFKYVPFSLLIRPCLQLSVSN